MTSTLLTLALLLPAAPAPAPKDTKPKGPAPRVVVISVNSDGTPYVPHTRQVDVTRQILRTVQVGQVVQQVWEAATIPQSVTVLVTLDSKDVEVYGTDGKKIDAKDVRKRVRKSVAALASTDGKPVDPFYLRLAREGTLVLVFPKSEATAPKLPVGERLIPAKP